MDACSSTQAVFGGLEFMIKEARRTVEVGQFLLPLQTQNTWEIQVENDFTRSYPLYNHLLLLSQIPDFMSVFGLRIWDVQFNPVQVLKDVSVSSGSVAK